MRGTYHIIVQNRYLKYEFDIKRNLTIIQGDSATGKTTLVDLIRSYHLEQRSGVSISCERPCRVLEGDLWREQISFIRDSILFIDEGALFVETEEFASAVKNSSNYYVIISRENLEMLPISVTEVYGIKSSGKFGSLEPVYHEMYRLYMPAEDNKYENVKPDTIIVEDSGAGYDFFTEMATKLNADCISAGGKSNIFDCILNEPSKKEILVVADGAAFASQMNKVLALMLRNKKIHLFLPESFEWILLSANIIKDREIESILLEPSVYVESEIYFSWERYFTSLLIGKTEGTYLQYSKSKLNENYIQANIIEKVIKHIKIINLDELH